MRLNLSDTIAAISTSQGSAGIGIVRLSGKDALKIADKIFLAKDRTRPSEMPTYTMRYGWIVEAKDKGQGDGSRDGVVDEVILSVMRSPRSYTKEDVVEINCHGGIVALRRVLNLVLAHGARLAEPGEFTKRAFLNGRIDLAQAEAVLDIIQAKTDSALKLGAEQLKGTLSKHIKRMRKILLDILASLEASIDFPDEEIEAVDEKKVGLRLNKVYQELKKILDSSQHGRILREGIHVVICGKPNVGKSSLLNALLKQERSIVTPLPGTTRDTIEEVIDIKGIPVRIVDTAGIIEPQDLVEKKAIQRSREQIRLADLIILVFDASRKIDGQDQLLIKQLKTKPVIALINKIDLKQRIEKEEILKYFHPVIEISAKKLKNIEEIEKAIQDEVFKGGIKEPERVMVSNLRHIQTLREAEDLIQEAINALEKNLSYEFISQNIKEALICFDEIIGKNFSEDLLEKIFSEFCIGK
ncbi:MAG: tRNA uridine-5-carboxymethylaminomethyl(34) synthesis GTPase MnmE [Candidatus Omnitrophica bacterium]|nr:tRNA uridine-5-carboxymethylaminomethyl(34) synthesis GTPase MnmE [Candidatus Omnitrophota bacterium]